MDSGTDDGLDPAVVERVRRDLAELGSDAASAPDVPPDVTARGGRRAAGRACPPSLRRPRLRRLQVLGLVVGLGAVAGRRHRRHVDAGPRPRADVSGRADGRAASPCRAPLRHPAAGPADRRTAGANPGLRAAHRPAAPRLLPRRSGLRSGDSRCSAPGRSTCTAGPRCCCCFPATHPKPWWPWWSSRTAMRLTPACWPTPWSLARNLSPGRTGTPRPRLVLHPCRRKCGRKAKRS